MRPQTIALGLAATAAVTAIALVWALRDAPPAVPLGEGSYAVRIPPDTPGPPRPVRLGEGLEPPIPTHRFWTSLITGDAPLPQYPHPLAVHPTEDGLRVRDPGPSIEANDVGIFGALAEDGGEDLILGSSAAPSLPDIRLEGYSDWFVHVGFSNGDAGARMQVAYGHGCPYVYALFQRGGARIRFPEGPTIWAGRAEDPTLGITVRGRPYGLFGPRGSTWSGLDGAIWTNEADGAKHFSLALLPAATPEALALFQRHAHAHVTQSRASFAYDEKSSTVSTRFEVETRAYEGKEAGTIFALYPHQWARTSARLLPGWSYASVRGPMRVTTDPSFTTTVPYPGILPSLPAADLDPGRRRTLLAGELERAESPPLDAYWEGKLLGRLATQVPIAEETGGDEAARLVRAIARRLESRFTALTPEGEVKPKDRLDYEPTWGTIIARPAAFGSDTSLNDHQLHYGYYIRAAAEVARLDPGWARDERFGALAKLLIRDIASPDRSDPLFPYLRCFDVYAGHSWASGDARSADGNNLESSSESMNAWSATILFGMATGDRALRDLGIALYATELAAIEAYWFDVESRTFPEGFKRPALGIIWGGKGVYETWFSKEPEAIYGINWLPFHGGSLYLGRYPDWASRSYEALRAARGSERWRLWPDLVVQFRALSDADDAARQLGGFGLNAPTEAGSSPFLLEHWVRGLRALGRVDRTVTADRPLYAVFRKAGKKTHVAYRMANEPAFTVTFSDGVTLRCEAPGFTTDR